MKPHKSMFGRVVVVTGASGGIGAAITRTFAEAGARVVMTYASHRLQAEQIAATLPGDDHWVAPLVVDDSDSVAALAAQVRAHYGRIDILVNNAGMTRFVAHADLDALDDDLIDQIFRVNWRGAFACVRAFKSLLMVGYAEGAGEPGLVVNISSIAGTTGNGSNIAYCASKAALNAMTLSLARALAPAVRVVAIAPGAVEGDYVDKLDPAWKAAQVERTPLKRLAEADDVAAAVLAVATSLRFSTGCIIPVDGGRPLT